jgi:hypothetical protein
MNQCYTRCLKNRKIGTAGNDKNSPLALGRRQAVKSWETTQKFKINH